MAETVTFTGMILTASPMKEFDKRVEVLTKERGRISAFARGARRLNSTLSACTVPFTFGKFTFYEGRNAYNLVSGDIETYFEEITTDYDALCYASYFAEMVQYLSREGIEAAEELLLMYITMRALQNRRISFELIRVNDQSNKWSVFYNEWNYKKQTIYSSFKVILRASLIHE